MEAPQSDCVYRPVLAFIAHKSAREPVLIGWLRCSTFCDGHHSQDQRGTISCPLWMGSLSPYWHYGGPCRGHHALGGKMLDKNPACDRCGGPTHYMGNITAPIQLPIQSIYECSECGRQTWVKVSAPLD